MSDVRKIAIDDIRENPVALRGVNKEDERYQGLVASIREKSFLGSISVREQEDADSGEKYFEIIDGLHRYSAARDAGLEEIPCVVTTMNKEEVLEAQVMMNLHKIETRPIEFTHQLQRMISNNPTISRNELAAKLGVSPVWINNRLGLLKLVNEIQALVDDGKITLSNAYVLAKLSHDEQPNYVDAAMTSAPSEFAATINARVKEIREARRQGRDPNKAGFQPVATFRKKGEIQDAFEKPNQVANVIGVEADAVKAVLTWVLQLDEASIERQKAKYDERQAKAEEKKKEAALERARKREEEAAAKRAELEAAAAEAE